MSSPQPISTSDNYTANLYPAIRQEGASTPVLGFCFSGGGSRALSCALGQLSALNAISDPLNSGQRLLNSAQYISSVSGGSWASILYTFLPASISDDTFLIQPTAPASLTAAAAATMNAQCLGSAPQQFNDEAIVDYLYLLYKWGFFEIDGPPLRSWFWIAGVGELILKPFGLYSAQYSSTAPYHLPEYWFSLSDAYIQANITEGNSSLTPSQFYTCRENRPALIVNFNLEQNFLEVDPPQIPIQATAKSTGIGGQSPDASICGGGSVESFAFTSTLTSAGQSGTASVTASRPYSLCDIAGCSSAFFAEFLLQYINVELAKLVTFIQQKYNLNDIEAGLLKFALEVLIDAESSEIEPQYNYWTLGEVSQANPSNSTYGFSDGGDFENSGILGLLAQTDVNRIVAFINTETPLSKGATQVVVDSSIPLLFGSYYPTGSQTYVSYDGMSPSQPMSYVQVFDNSGGELDALCQGLYDASCGGANQDSNLGSYTATFTQTLTTVENPVANIASGRQVKVIWVYNNRVNQWQNAIQDQGLAADLAAGQGPNPSGTLMNFPNFDTVNQIYLAPEAVNMLAHLSAWNVQQLAGDIQALLQS